MPPLPARRGREAGGSRVSDRIAAVLLVLVAASCGGRPAPLCDLPTAAERPATVERFCDGQCILETHDALGRPVRLECDGTACQLFVDDEPWCACDDLDWANTCTHGLPTCLATSGLFSFADYTYDPACD
jgi:hypothetical protein